jgi:hydrogenase expression/formation protein HypD
MKYIDEYRNSDLVRSLSAKIKRISSKNIRLMEVCGGHTMSIQKFGILTFLPENIQLISGPGCPVCVSDLRFIDKATAYARMKDVIIASFGDLIRVPGSQSTLDEEKANGADIRIIYSPVDAIHLALENKNKKVVFLGIGFETTAPGTAAAIVRAHKLKLNNFFVLSTHKLMPPAMKALIDEDVALDGYIAPGHVSTITGSHIYDFIAEDLKIPVVVSGFEPTDVLQSILMLVQQIEQKEPKVEIQYKRVVTENGNVKAQQILNDVFIPADEWWRGLGVLPNSGLQIADKYKAFDVNVGIPITVPEPKEPKGCICGEILKGIKMPKECKLFGKVCTPENPVGACMVSTEGSCQAYYKYNIVE